MFSYTDRSGAPALKLVLRGVNGYVWKLCYEDIEEVVNALRVFVGLWTRQAKWPEGAAIRVFRGIDRKLSLHGAFEVGEMATT